MQAAAGTQPSSPRPGDEGNSDDTGSPASSAESPKGYDDLDVDEDGDDVQGGKDVAKRGSRSVRRKQPEHVPCGILPSGSSVEEFHRPPLRLHSRNAEGKYFQSFAESLSAAQSEIDVDAIRYAEHATWSLDPQAALESFENQKAFFRSVDGFRLEPTELLPSRADKKHDDFDVALARARRALPQRPASTSVVMEAAFFLLEQGLLHIPDVGSINVEQARAFQWNAAWLQQHMTAVWLANGTLSAASTGSAVQPFRNYCLAIVGPGGTGKTAVLKICETLTVFFAGPETVRKLAPSNAAAIGSSAATLCMRSANCRGVRRR